MVFAKFKERFSQSNDKYEILYHRYSKIKLENKQLKERCIREITKSKEKVHLDLANDLIKIYKSVETAKSSSYKVVAINKEIQKLLIDLNLVEKKIKDTMNKFSIEEVEAKERFYDSELHEVANYVDARGMKANLIIKTVKKGFKINQKLVIKARVVISK